MSEAINPTQGLMSSDDAKCKEYIAIWDTGATNSAITEKVIQDCQLSPIGIVEVQYGSGPQRSNQYLVNIWLPNKTVISNLKVTKANITNADVIIGMDIIGSGDFAVTNIYNQTVFSFRSPSMERIDFVNKPFKPKPKFALPKGKRKR
ncbi:MAG: hypothetical protein ABSF88_02615 [Candidatus Aminicenantales bacterium]